MIGRVTAFALALWLAGATHAAAQAKPRPRTPPTPPPRDVQTSGYAMFGRVNFTAADSFDVILGSPGGLIMGGGVRVTFPQGFFVDAGAWRFHGEGERVFVANGQEFPLGIPVEISVVPLEISGGYRFWLGRMPKLRPYVAGGISSYAYSEESQFADASENVSERFTGYHLLGGVEYRVSRWVGVGGEFAWATVPDALGEGGVSETFDETNLGGTSFRFKITIGR